jgi:hypothetical protein
VDRHQHAFGVGDDVGVGEEFVFPDQETGADSAAETTAIPWRGVVGGLVGDLDPHDRFVDVGRSGRGLLSVGDGKNEGEKGKPKLHEAEARAKSFRRKGEGGVDL